MKNLRNSMEIRKIAALLSFYILLFTSSLAQVEINANDLLSGLVSVAFIIIFIIILLAVGGVIKKPSGRTPWFLIFFIALIILLFVVPQFIKYPQYFDETSLPKNFREWPLPSYASQIFIMLGLPEGWMYVPAIIYLFILPFTAIYTLVWAFLQSLGIFADVPSTVNRVLAFIIAFLTIPFGWFVKLVWILFSFMGAWSVVIFAATFIVGIFFRGYGAVGKEYALALKTYESVHNELINKINELKKRVDELGSDDIERETARLAEKYGALYPKIKDLHAEVLKADTVNAKREKVKNWTLEGEAKSK
jgi:hypothetical protein